MADIVCTDPDHDSRSNEAGWSALLGVTDRPEPPTNVLCAACAVHLSPAEDSSSPTREEELAGQIAELQSQLNAVLDLLAGEV